jgi:hypothetical protein
MGGDDSQKLLPWRGISLLSGAQKTSGFRQNQHSNSNPGVPTTTGQASLGSGSSLARAATYDREENESRADQRGNAR